MGGCSSKEDANVVIPSAQKRPTYSNRHGETESNVKIEYNLEESDTESEYEQEIMTKTSATQWMSRPSPKVEKSNSRLSGTNSLMSNNSLPKSEHSSKNSSKSRKSVLSRHSLKSKSTQRQNEDEISDLEDTDKEIYETLTEIYEHTKELAMKSDEIHKMYLPELTSAKQNIDELKKFQEQGFKIAIIGNEKSGKSSLINAWIGHDLLPSKEFNCTYAITEVRWLANLTEQRCDIEYFTSQEFNQLEFANDFTDEETLEMKRNLNKSVKNIYAQDVEQLGHKLVPIMCDPNHARTVKKICISLPAGNKNQSAVLTDLPGYNPNIGWIESQIKTLISHVDVIVYAKRITPLDRFGSEKEFVRVCESNSALPSVRDKMCVALTFCDQSKSETSNLQKMHARFWDKYGLDTARIMPVFSLARSKNQADSEYSAFDELKEGILKKMNDLNKQKLADLANEIKQLALKVLDSIKSAYNVDKNSEVDHSSIDSQKMQREWFAKHWKQIVREFQIYFQTEIRPRADADSPVFVTTEDLDFKKFYDERIRTVFKSIEATRKDFQTKVYLTCTNEDGIQNPEKGNIKIRKILAKEFLNSLDKLTNEFHKFLLLKVNKMVDWIESSLWNMPEIRDELIGSEEERNLKNVYYKKSLDSLLQKLTRPAINIFIENPRTKVVRMRVMQEYQMELMVMDKFIDANGEYKNRGLFQYLSNGKHGDFNLVLKSSNIISDISRFNLKSGLERFEAAQPDLYAPFNGSDSQFDKLVFSPPPERLAHVQKEIEEDINEFLACMTNSVFHASGICRFYGAELEKVKRAFLEMQSEKHLWSHYFEKHAQSTDPDPKIKIPKQQISNEQNDRIRMAKHVRAIWDLLRELE